MSPTLGSLFDGIGGFPLAAVMNGITPVWASEIGAAAVSITKKWFPDMLHLGNILEISGADIEPVDIITFGSPCQDLSVAGKREGLDGERSGLFMEAVRIIREMRGATNGAKPRWCVWENVYGAFSSNGGADFLTVVREIAETADENIHIPRPPATDGIAVWEPAGAAMGDGGSLAWRVLGAQFWGVPQRRRRIFLVADFGGGRAGEVLFKPDGLRRDTAAGAEAGEGAAAGAESGADKTVWPETVGALLARHDGSPCIDRGQPFVCAMRDTAGTLRANAGAPKHESDWEGLVLAAGFTCGQSADARGIGYQDETSPTLRGGEGGDKCPAVLFVRGNVIDRTEKSGANGLCVAEDVAYTLDTTDRHAVCFAPSSFGGYAEGMGTLRANGGDLGGGSEALVATYQQTAGTLMQRDCKGAGHNYENSDKLISDGYSVRRLTPLECERLQGFPDGWTAQGHDGKQISDGARYKALGNSVAIPCVAYVMGNMARVMEAG